MDALGLRAAREANGSDEPELRILVIDDDDSVATAIRLILARRRSETELASRASIGIQTLESSRFDALLIDLFMPGMSGLDAITHIRHRGSPIPIIAMSGFRLRSPHNSFDYMSLAMQRGASAYLRKPFSPEQLIEAINRSLASASPANESA
jgi:CheY-like chemotaxis protein